MTQTNLPRNFMIDSSLFLGIHDKNGDKRAEIKNFVAQALSQSDGKIYIGESQIGQIDRAVWQNYSGTPENLAKRDAYFAWMDDIMDPDLIEVIELSDQAHDLSTRLRRESEVMTPANAEALAEARIQGLILYTGNEEVAREQEGWLSEARQPYLIGVGLSKNKTLQPSENVAFPGKLEDKYIDSLVARF